MRLQLLSGSLLAVPLFLNGVQAAPSASSKLAKLENLSASASDKVIRLNSALYDEFTAPPREGYSISIVLTALKPQFNCAQCRYVLPFILPFPRERRILTWERVT